MLQLFSVALLVCSGSSATYDMKLKVDHVTKSIEATMIDQDGKYGWFIRDFKDLATEDNCLVSTDIRFCQDLSKSNEAHVSIRFENKYSAHWEHAELECY